MSLLIVDVSSINGRVAIRDCALDGHAKMFLISSRLPVPAASRYIGP